MFDMLGTKILTTIKTVAALLILWGTAFSLQEKIDSSAAVWNISYSPLVLPADILRGAALEYKEAAADIVWLQAVQVLGGHHDEATKNETYRPVYDLINRVTDLDKRFEYAYMVGGISLSILSDHVDLSNTLLQKGLDNNTVSWEIPFYIGFNHMYHYKDPKKAAYYMQLAMNKDGAPAGIAFFVASLYEKNGNTRAALVILEHLYNTAPNEQIKEEIMKKMLTLQKEVQEQSSL